MISSRLAHLFHICFFLLFVFIFEYFTISSSLSENSIVNPIDFYGLPITIVLYMISLLPLLPLPIILSHTYGLLFYNVFPQQIIFEKSSSFVFPQIIIRVITRGDYPKLVYQNIQRNLEICSKVGLEKFSFEIVTEKSLNLNGLPLNEVHQIFVPKEYQTKTGALYKARALQYALELNLHHLSDDDFIIHLDEETLLTENSLRGILHFIHSNDYDIGQGLITYSNHHIGNLWITLADSARVGIDLGTLRFSLKKLHRPLFLFKGSFLVCRAKTESDISFDNGSNGSIAEDIFFAMLAQQKNKRFNWIEGEMWENSPFTWTDFIKQRKRWIQGIFLVSLDQKLSYRLRFLLNIALYSWLTVPLSSLNIIILPFFPLPLHTSLKFLISYVGAVSIYLYIIGTIRSFPLVRYGYRIFLLRIISTIIIIPFALLCETIAILWAIFTDKNQFHIINKQLNTER